jgi:hypothetical protein
VDQFGYIDSASVYEVVNLFGHDSVATSYPWALENTLTVTTALITTDIGITPGPGPSGVASEGYGLLCKHLASAIVRSSMPQGEAQQALEETKTWMRQNVSALSSTFLQLMSDDTNFVRWLDWYISHNWIEHSRRLDGLYNEDLLSEIGLGLKQANLGCSPNDLRKVLDRSRTISVVEEWAKKKTETEEFKIARAAFVISTLIRGHYHDLAAKKSRQFVRHHPFRPSTILPPLPNTVPYQLIAPNQVVHNLVVILVNSAFEEPMT